MQARLLPIFIKKLLKIFAILSGSFFTSRVLSSNLMIKLYNINYIWIYLFFCRKTGPIKSLAVIIRPKTNIESLEEVSQNTIANNQVKKTSKNLVHMLKTTDNSKFSLNDNTIKNNNNQNQNNRKNDNGDGKIIKNLRSRDILAATIKAVTSFENYSVGTRCCYINYCNNYWSIQEKWIFYLELGLATLFEE